MVTLPSYVNMISVYVANGFSEKWSFVLICGMANSTMRPSVITSCAKCLLWLLVPAAIAPFVTLRSLEERNQKTPRRRVRRVRITRDACTVENAPTNSRSADLALTCTAMPRTSGATLKGRRIATISMDLPPVHVVKLASTFTLAPYVSAEITALNNALYNTLFPIVTRFRWSRMAFGWP